MQVLSWARENRVTYWWFLASPLSICNEPLTTCRLHKALVSRSIYLYIETNLYILSYRRWSTSSQQKTVQSLSEDKHHSSQVKHYLMEVESAHEYFLIISTWIKIYNNLCLLRIITGSFYLCIKLFSDYITCKPVNPIHINIIYIYIPSPLTYTIK